MTVHPRPADPASDRQRFERLYRDHYAALSAFARRRTGGVDLAQEVVANTFLVAWRRRDSIPADERPWLFAVARNEIGTLHRSHRRARSLVEKLRRTTVEPAPLVEADTSGDLAGAFNSLSARDREVLSLHVWEELDGVEGAKALGCSQNAYAIRLHRARSRLRDQVRRLERDGREVEAAEHTPTPKPTGEQA
jgi:RNA polymerase sigma factor (sigma-70 family)